LPVNVLQLVPTVPQWLCSITDRGQTMANQASHGKCKMQEVQVISQQQQDSQVNVKKQK